MIVAALCGLLATLVVVCVLGQTTPNYPTASRQFEKQAYVCLGASIAAGILVFLLVGFA